MSAVMKRFNVVIPKEDGGVEVHPMKEWLRQHPDQLPAGFDATDSTSHQLRNALKKQGWRVQESASETRLILPGTAESFTAIESVLGDSEDEEESETQTRPTFGLEYQLRDFIAENISAISVKGRRLKLYVDATGRDGIEYPTTVGPIDILAIDDDGSFFVFELKRSHGSDRVVGQLARYMGWVSSTIGKGKEVNGVIVATHIDQKLRYAASIIPNVSLFEYQVEFHLNEAGDIE